MFKYLLESYMKIKFYVLLLPISGVSVARFVEEFHSWNLNLIFFSWIIQPVKIEIDKKSQSAEKLKFKISISIYIKKNGLNGNALL